MKTKVLILHTSVGGGIRATAENIAEQLEASGRYEVRNFDVEKVESGATASTLRGLYLTILDHISGLWGFIYHSKLVLVLTKPFRKILSSFNSGEVLKILREFQPAIVISTGVNPSAIMAYLKSKGLYRGKFVIVFSDYHIHEFWLHDEADLLVCNIPEQIPVLKALGFPDEKIALTGTLVADKFRKSLSREEALAELNLLTSMPVVLVGGAGRARSSMKEVFTQLLRSPKSFQVVAICGSNKALVEELKQISAPSRHPVKILGFVNNMEVLMSAAQVLVYKTGGPSMAEAVIKKLPIVFIDVRPGHELTNLDYLVAHGIGKNARIPREAVFFVEEILDGKLKFDFDRGLRSIVTPPGATSITQAIDSVNPENQGRK